MKNTMIDMETATKNLQVAAKSLGTTMREVSEGLKLSTKYISYEQALKSIYSRFNSAKHDLIKGLSATKL